MRENPDDQRGLFDRSDDLQFAATLTALDRLFRVESEYPRFSLPAVPGPRKLSFDLSG